MKTTTLLTLVAAATLGYATPVPEQQAEAAQQGQQSKAGTAEKGTYPPQGVQSWGGSGGYPPAPQSYDPASFPPPHPYGGPPPPLPYGGSPPPDPSYPPYYGYPPPPPAPKGGSGGSGGFGGSGGGVIVGGSGGGAGGVVTGGGFGFGFGGGKPPAAPSCDAPWCTGLPPGQDWHVIEFPQDSPFNNGGLQQIAGDCSAQQQAVSCCNGDSDSSGVVGGVLPAGACSFNLLSDHCSQNVACCDTTGGGILTIGGLCQLVNL